LLDERFGIEEEVDADVEGRIMISGSSVCWLLSVVSGLCLAMAHAEMEHTMAKADRAPVNIRMLKSGW